MKTMTCNQIGGACEVKFRAETFDEIADLSKKHGLEMHQKQDAAHLQAMQKMTELMKNPGDMGNWFESKRTEFNELPDS